MSVDGAVKALCDRLTKRSDTRTGKDLSEQCIKVTFIPVKLIELIIINHIQVTFFLPQYGILSSTIL